MNDNVVCIVQARMGSTRLPGKVLMNLAGKPMLQHIIERLRNCNNINKVIIATSNKEKDNNIEKLCDKLGIVCFRGSEKNVLSRYYFCANENNADIIVRITADCPLIDPELVDSAIYFFKKNSYDYVSPRSKDGLIRGLDVEVFSINALKKAFENCKDEKGIEHVTYYMYSNENDFKVKGYPIPDKYNLPSMRLCVDEEDDFKKIKKIYDKFYKGEILNTQNMVNYLLKNPNVNNINKNIKQKCV